MTSRRDDVTGSESYADLRAVGQTMAAKVLDMAESLGFTTRRATRALGIPMMGKHLILRDETDVAALSDYTLSELKVEGRPLAETCDPMALELTPLETAHLEAFRRSRCSLFVILKALPEKQQLVLRDVLEPDRPEISLTDVNLCQSFLRMNRKVLVFLRLLEVGGFVMSSGVLFVFPPKAEERLLQSFRQKMKKVPPEEWSSQMFVFFYQKQKQWGEAQRYEHVPTG